MAWWLSTGITFFTSRNRVQICVMKEHWRIAGTYNQSVNHLKSEINLNSTHKFKFPHRKHRFLVYDLMSLQRWWDITPCLFHVCFCMAYYSALSVEVRCFSETSVCFHRTVWCRVPEDVTVHCFSIIMTNQSSRAVPRKVIAVPRIILNT
jgi:hypothetical protein